MRDKLKAQDWLTTVVEQEADASTARVTASMVDFLPPGDPLAIIDRLADPAIRIVSLTITEGGYYIDPATQAFNRTHPDIAYDAEHFDEPKTVFGIILAGLQRRRDLDIVPFTVMSCDNIPGNGHVTENAIVGLAESLGMMVTANGIAAGDELKMIAAVVIGGGSLLGGEGNLVGAAFGTLIMTTINMGSTQLGIANWIQEIITGLIIVVAVALDRYRMSRPAKIAPEAA